MFFESITEIKGVGAARAKAFEKLNIFTVSDMLYHFPRRFEDRSEMKTVFELIDGETAAFSAVPYGEMSVNYVRKGMTVYRQTFTDETGTIDAVWFNNPYVKNAFKKGVRYNFYGKISAKYRKKEVTAPIFENSESARQTGRIIPIYNLTAGLTQNVFMQTMEKCIVASKGCVPETIPPYIRKKYNLAAIDFSMQNIHFPKDNESFALSRRRFVFEEFFELRTGLALARRSRKKSGTAQILTTPLADFLKLLPFKPTNAQQKAMEEIFSDINKTTPMNRLVQGDVGCGKTVVACAALYAAAKSGFQGAFMAPTEILAAQHYESLQKMFPGINIVLLSGSLTAAQKKAVKAQIADGTAQIAIGTHALFEDTTVFKNLALVITDEQHRFGVKQRSALSEKGKTPHTLVMSATPIPRTLSQVLYGDLDVSIIDELPPGRQKVDTYFIDSGKRGRALNFVKKELEKGNRAYIVCPLVEEGELAGLQNVTEYTEKIKTEYFKDYNVACVHGKMKSSEKDKIMEGFYSGEIQVLVATTVIEVGVNVPEANIMIIENAERFGLSQLHQLRGRVGRGAEKSYCIMISDNDSDITKKRLKIMTETNDGFKISEEDLKLRGPGDFFGTRQHGLPELKIANIFTDGALLKEAGCAASEVLKKDRDLKLPEHADLRRRIALMFANKKN
ncbi:MAG: ATP-dependent DNA helicase RecG [Clostridia bacterium]|nr:ATP-dependent DNA helicase RecG [Clostridia bacterium]